MDKKGIVVQVQQDIAVIEVGGSGCGDHCDCSGSCDSAIQIIKVKNVLNASVGDSVELEAAENVLLKMTFLVYTVPLILFVLGLFVGFKVGSLTGQNPEMWAVGLGFLFSAVVVALYAKFGNKNEEVVVMKRLIQSSVFPLK